MKIGIIEENDIKGHSTLPNKHMIFYQGPLNSNNDKYICIKFGLLKPGHNE